MKPPFTKSELHAEVKATMFVFAHEIGRAYTYNGAFALLGLTPPPSESDWADPFLDEGAFQAFNLSKTWLARELDNLYDYAFEARLSAKLDFSVVTEDLAHFLRTVQAHAGMDEIAYELTRSDASTRRFQQVMELVYARAVLNGDWPDAGDFSRPLESHGDSPREPALTLHQLALLAQVDEKTLRNAASGSNKHPLKTISVRGRTFIEVGEARRWLEARGQFLPTIYSDRPTTRDLVRQPFVTLKDLADYVRARIAELPPHPPRLSDAVAALVEDIVEERPLRDPRTTEMVALAHSIEAEPASFATALLAVQYSHRQQALERELAEISRTAPPPRMQ